MNPPRLPRSSRPGLPARRVLTTLALAWLVAAGGCARASGQFHTDMPLSRVRMYESGVTYFERSGSLRGGSAFLDVPDGHLDDAIKTLIVLSPDGEVLNVAFDSRLSPAVARARAGLPVDGSTPLGLHAILTTLEGAEVELRVGKRRMVGTIVDVVDASEDIRPDATVELEATIDPLAPDYSPRGVLTFLGRDGQFSRVEVSDVVGVRPVDVGLRTRLQAALSSGRRTKGIEHRGIDVRGTGGDVTLGYLAEAPVWRTTYRLVLARPDAQGARAATLQAWALVHNDTDEAWNGVTLEVVDGRPDSFLYPLAAPRYERRELETPPTELSSVPQLLGTTPDAMWGDFADDVGGLGLIGTGGGGGGYGYGGGSGSGSAGGRGGGKGVRSGASSSDLLAVGDLATTQEAASEEQPMSVVFVAAQPLDLAPQHSAMVPIIQAPVAARPVVWFPGFDLPPRTAIALDNTTSRTLPEGPLSVFVDGGFSGETVLRRLKPAEHIMLDVGDERDVELEIVDSHGARERKQLVFRNGVFEIHYLAHTTRTIRLHNRSGLRREVYLALPIGTNASVEGAESVEFDAERRRPMGKLTVGPASEIERTLVTHEGLVDRVAPESLEAELLAELREDPNLSEEVRKRLEPVVVQRKALDAQAARAAAIATETTEINAELDRLRATLSAIGDGGGNERAPLVRRVIALEDQLQKLRAETAKLDAAHKASDDAMLTALEVFRPAAPPPTGATPTPVPGR